MAVRHRDLPLEGVQFHPESVLTEGGHQLLATWLVTCGDPDAPARAVGLSPVVDPRLTARYPVGSSVSVGVGVPVGVVGVSLGVGGVGGDHQRDGGAEPAGLAGCR